MPDYRISVDDDTNVITLEVKEGIYKPYYYKSKAYKRNDTATIEVDRLELNRLILEGEDRSYDELASDVKDLEFTILEGKMKEQLGISAISTDILRTIGVLGADGKYNNAGVLLADKNGTYGIDCVCFGETIDIILDREIFEHRSILKQYDEVIELYRKYYQYDEIKGAIRETVETIPEKAFRETIANALVHRAWDVRSHIRVAMYERSALKFFHQEDCRKASPGRNISMDRSLALVNPIIGAVFFRLNIIESFGTGVQRINAAPAGSKAKPIHEFSENMIKVTLPVITSGGASYWR